MGTTTDIHSHQVITQQLPNKVVERLNDWWNHFKFWRRFHYSIGTIGAALSACAATDAVGVSSFLAAAAAVCFAVMGFTHPERNYLQYVRAWRVLDVACKRYQYDQSFTIKRLLDAVEYGEKVISEFEYLPEGGLEKKASHINRPRA
jgi:hypothetical protein